MAQATIVGVTSGPPEEDVGHESGNASPADRVRRTVLVTQRPVATSVILGG